MIGMYLIRRVNLLSRRKLEKGANGTTGGDQEALDPDTLPDHVQHGNGRGLKGNGQRVDATVSVHNRNNANTM